MALGSQLRARLGGNTMTDTITTSPLSRTVAGRLVPTPGTYQIDVTHTTVDFVARHLMVAKVRGTFRDVQGTLTVGETPESSSLDVTVGLASVDTREEARDT